MHLSHSSSQRKFSYIPVIPDCEKVWEEDDDDSLLLRILAEIGSVVSITRTILATGVIAMINHDFCMVTGHLYSVEEIVRRIFCLRTKFLEFECFKSVPGIKYDEEANTVTTGHMYLMAHDLTEENPMCTNFRLKSEPLYKLMKDVFGAPGLGTIHLGWVYAYFKGDETALKNFPYCP